MNKYGIQFDFDEEGSPPRVYIADRGGRGTCYLEVFEEPTLQGQLWSWDDSDWEPGTLAKSLVEFMNRGVSRD